MKLKRRKIVAKQKELKVIELFAGIGAWAKGLITAGIKHKVVAVVEFDKKTIQCYNAIHGTQFEPMDITKLSGDELPDCDMICYSPPCQAFSVAGRQEGFNDERGILFFDALRIINSKKPKYALMENVKGLTGKKFKNEFESMLKALEDAGYNNHWKVLNAKDYGIPQNRERVFVVSIRNDIKKDFRFPLPFDNRLRLRDMLEETVDEKYYISEDKCRKLLEDLKDKQFKTFNVLQRVGDRDNPSVSVKDTSFTIPANPMSDRGQVVCVPTRQICKTIRTSGRSSFDRHSWDIIVEQGDDKWNY